MNIDERKNQMRRINKHVAQVLPIRLLNPSRTVALCCCYILQAFMFHEVFAILITSIAPYLTHLPVYSSSCHLITKINVKIFLQKK